MANEFDEVSETQPTNKSFAVISDFLKRYTEKNALDKFFLGGLQKLAETLAYDEPLTTGKGETLRFKPEALELANLVPQFKGGAAVAGVGPVGLRRLAETDPTLWWKTVTKLKDTLQKANPLDWKTQKALIEEMPNFFAVPRGRDALDIEYLKRFPSTVKFGMELPEAKGKNLEEFLNVKPNYDIGLPALFDSPRHYQAYPKLRDFDVRYDPKMGNNSATLSFGEKKISVGLHENPQDLLDTLNHEVTHAVQRYEGWPYGTNREEALQRLKDISTADKLGEPLPRELAKQEDLAKQLRRNEEFYSNFPNMAKHMEGLIAYDAYRRSAGEQLAEAVAQSARMGGGKITKYYDQPVSRMYDPAVQQGALDRFFEGMIKQGEKVPLKP